MNAAFMEKFNNKLNMIRLTAKPIVENDMAWQQHRTPDKVIDMMLDMYYENKEFKNNEKILILFNVEFINRIYIKYINELIFGNIYFIADSKEKYDVVKRHYSNIHIVLCDEHEVEKLVEKIGEFKVKKFDVVFSNPPYNDNLDLKILEHLFKISENIIFVHPSSFLLDNKNIKAIFKRIKDFSFLEKVILLWGNDLFNIGLFVPICISYWNIKKTDNKINVNDTAFIKKIYNVNNINDISMHGDLNNIKEFLNHIQKFIEKNGSMLSNKAVFYDKNKKNIKFSAIRGNQPVGHPVHHTGFTLDFFSFLSMDIENNLNIKDDDIKKCLIFSFNSENERTNFISYCKTKFSRFCLSFYKINSNLNRGETAIIPWLDFTKEWNDAKLCKEFNISKELWNYIDNFIPDYYDDYKSGFEEENGK